MTNENGIIRLGNGGGGEIRIRVSEWKGKTYIDVRKWYFDPPANSTPREDAERPADFFKPTAKGISLAPEQWEQILPELNKLAKKEAS